MKYNKPVRKHRLVVELTLQAPILPGTARDALKEVIQFHIAPDKVQVKTFERVVRTPQLKRSFT